MNLLVISTFESLRSRELCFVLVWIPVSRHLSFVRLDGSVLIIINQHIHQSSLIVFEFPRIQRSYQDLSRIFRGMRLADVLIVSRSFSIEFGFWEKRQRHIRYRFTVLADWKIYSDRLMYVLSNHEVWLITTNFVHIIQGRFTFHPHSRDPSRTSAFRWWLLNRLQSNFSARLPS